MIRNVTFDDANVLAEIYNYYIEHSVITFEENCISADEMRERIKVSQASNYPWLVFESENKIFGYTYAGLWKTRSAYRNTVESTIYLHHQSIGRGVGSELYTALIEKLSALGFHVVIGAIALPNPASVKLHEKMGFEKVAQFSEVGFKHERWVDVGYWQRIL